MARTRRRAWPSRPTARSWSRAVRAENFALARYTAGGALDPSFSGDGLQTTDFGREDGATAVAIQADGRIVVGGRSGDDFALARYDAAGVLDTSFSGDGRLTTDFGGFDSGKDVAIGADGKIVARGHERHAGRRPASTSRWPATSPTVRSTPTFSGDGRQTTDFGGSTYDSGEGVAIQADGRIVVTGYGRRVDTSSAATTRATSSSPATTPTARSTPRSATTATETS